MSEENAALAQCQEKIGYSFKDKGLLAKALIHASSASDRLLSNERLEFLGDAVLDLIVCRELYDRFPHYLEGELTKIKSLVVSRRICTRIAEKIELAQFLRVGKGMLTHPELPASCSAAVLESVIGAIYIDGGEEPVAEFIRRHVGPHIDAAAGNRHQDNFKSMLQQYTQDVMNTTPIYELLDEKGPDHSKCFEVGVTINQRRFAAAWGPNKKAAQQIAAFLALQELEIISRETQFPGVPPTP